jgi:hypothetical protein
MLAAASQRGSWVFGYTVTRRSRASSALRFKAYGMSTRGAAKLDVPHLDIVDAPLCIQPTLPPLQDASPLILELSLVSCGGVELVGENAARVVGVHGNKASGQAVDTTRDLDQ